MIFLKLKIREKHSDCYQIFKNPFLNTRSKSETATDLISFAKISQIFETSKYFPLKIVIY